MESSDQHPYLTRFGINLTKEFEDKTDIQPIIGRDKEVRRASEILSQKYKNNLLLTGLPGVGKTAIIEGLAQQIARGESTKALEGKEIWVLDLATLTSVSEGETFQGRMKALITEIEQSDGKIIPFIDEFHTIMGAGASDGKLDAANILKPALSRGTLHMIGATTLWEYHLYLENDGAMTRRFGRVQVEEPSVDDTVSILRSRRRSLEIFHGVTITDDSIKSAVDLSVRYLTNRQLPDKAIDVLDQAGASTRLNIDSMPRDLASLQNKMSELRADLKTEHNSSRQKQIQDELGKIEPEFTKGVKDWEKQKLVLEKLKEMRTDLQGDYSKLFKLDTSSLDKDVDAIGQLKDIDIPAKEKKLNSLKEKYRALNPMIDDEVSEMTIMKVIEDMTSIPVSQLSESELDRMRNLEKNLHKRVIGQDEAVYETAYAVKRSRLGLGDPGKPIGAFLFLGPTGVGKTELAKTLAEEMFGSENNMVRFDMGEFQDRRSITRLIGAAPGDSGYEDGGELTEYVKNNPYSIVLLDEAEKAHPGIWDLMLSVFDDGELTDNKGELVNFKNTILIMTSNIGSAEILRGIDPETGKLSKNTYNEVMAMLRNPNPDKGGKGFRPEFINRLDSIVMFLKLTRDNEEQIAKLKLNSLRKRVAKSRKIKLVFSKPIQRLFIKNTGPDLTVAKFMADSLSADDMNMGGRPLDRLIKRELEDPLVDMLLEEGIEDGSYIYIQTKYPEGPQTYIGEDGKERPTKPVLEIKQITEGDYNTLITQDPFL